MRVLDGDNRFYALQAAAIAALAASGCPFWLALAGLGLGAGWAVYSRFTVERK